MVVPGAFLDCQPRIMKCRTLISCSVSFVDHSPSSFYFLSIKCVKSFMKSRFCRESGRHFLNQNASFVNKIQKKYCFFLTFWNQTGHTNFPDARCFAHLVSTLWLSYTAVACELLHICVLHVLFSLRKCTLRKRGTKTFKNTKKHLFMSKNHTKWWKLAWDAYNLICFWRFLEYTMCLGVLGKECKSRAHMRPLQDTIWSDESENFENDEHPADFTAPCRIFFFHVVLELAPRDLTGAQFICWECVVQGWTICEKKDDDNTKILYFFTGLKANA